MSALKVRRLGQVSAQEPTGQKRDGAEEGEPQHIPEQPIVTVHANPVDAEHPMRQHPVDQVPDTEPDEHRGRNTASAHRPGVPVPPQQPEARDGDHVHQGVEVSVGGDLEAQVASFKSAEQMVPLKDLVQEDAVEKPPERKAEEPSGDRRRS